MQKPQLTVVKSGSKASKKTLALGDRAPQVRDLKVALASAGMMTLNDSDEFDGHTHKAVILLQNRFGLKTTGVFDQSLCEPLQKAIEQATDQQAAIGVGLTPVETVKTMSAQDSLLNDGKLAAEQPGLGGPLAEVISMDERKSVATLDTADPPVPWPVLVGAGFVLVLIGTAFFNDRARSAAPVMLD